MVWEGRSGQVKSGWSVSSGQISLLGQCEDSVLDQCQCAGSVCWVKSGQCAGSVSVSVCWVRKLWNYILSV